MNATSQVMVTQHVPLRWLVVGLVCDTLETGRRLRDAGQPAFAGN